jgi:putative heme iron utilization protein
MQRTNIYLEERQTSQLDRLAAHAGVSRAEVIRRLLDRALDGAGGTLADDLAAIDETWGSLRDVAAPSRGLSERDRHLERLWEATQ